VSITRGRLPFEKNYTRIPNSWARDGRLSRKARGLLVELLSHKVGWKVTTQDLVKDGKEGRDAVMSAIKELATLGYLRVNQERDAGRFDGINYSVGMPFEAPNSVADEDDDEPFFDAESVDNFTANGFPRHGVIRSGIADLPGADNPPLKKTILKKTKEDQSSPSEATTEPPVDNFRDDDGIDSSQLGWRGRIRLAGAERRLDIELLERDFGHLFADFDNPSRILYLVVLRILSVPAAAGTKVTSPTGYVAKALTDEPEVHRKRAFAIESTS
jgi:hypothetical protein